MNIVIASLNKTKVKAVAAVFQDCEVIPKSLPSDVSDQPIGDEETRKGAINRAKHAAALAENSIGIGLEGGVMFVDHELYLCNWGALVDQHKHVFTASGARIRLPDDFQKDLLNGVELSVLMDAFTKKKILEIMKEQLAYLQTI